MIATAKFATHPLNFMKYELLHELIDNISSDHINCNNADTLLAGWIQEKWYPIILIDINYK